MKTLSKLMLRAASCAATVKIHSKLMLLTRQNKDLQQTYAEGNLTQDQDEDYLREVIDYFSARLGKKHIDRGQSSEWMWVRIGYATLSASFNLSMANDSISRAAKTLRNRGDTGYSGFAIRQCRDSTKD